MRQLFFTFALCGLSKPWAVISINCVRIFLYMKAWATILCLQKISPPHEYDLINFLYGVYLAVNLLKRNQRKKCQLAYTWWPYLLFFSVKLIKQEQLFSYLICRLLSIHLVLCDPWNEHFTSRTSLFSHEIHLTSPLFRILQAFSWALMIVYCFYVPPVITLLYPLFGRCYELLTFDWLKLWSCYLCIMITTSI